MFSTYIMTIKLLNQSLFNILQNSLLFIVNTVIHIINDVVLRKLAEALNLLLLSFEVSKLTKKCQYQLKYLTLIS